MLDGEAEVVYGNRTFGSHTAFSFWYVMGNKGVTFAANLLFNSLHQRPGDLLQADAAGRSTARWTCARPASAWRPRSPASCCSGGIRPYEVPIRYRARSREEGKKITWRDGVEALWILTRIRLGRSG